MKIKEKKEKEYLFINKTLFFPEKGILAIGDLHIGYEESLRDSGILLPEHQVKETIENIQKVIEKINSLGFTLKKVVFLGDVKHMFSYEWKEKANFNKILNFLKEHVEENNIIIIKGNHDTTSLGLKLKDYLIEGNIAFVHGHDFFLEIFDKKVEIVVSGHLHPSVILEEKKGVKKEKYKCFLEGTSQGKTFIVMPSFLDFYEGTPVNHYKDDFIESFSIIPRKDILKFKVHVVSDDFDTYDFGTVGSLN